MDRWSTTVWISSAVLAGGAVIAIIYAVNGTRFGVDFFPKKRKDVVGESSTAVQDSREEDAERISEAFSVSLDEDHIEEEKPQLLFKKLLADNSREPFRHLPTAHGATEGKSSFSN